MELIIRAENEQEEQLLKAKEVGYKGVDTCFYAVRWREGGVLEKSYSWSFGDVTWLLGKIYIGLKALESLFYGGSRSN